MHLQKKGKHVKKTSVNLGRVLDRERGIFQNRKMGVFTFSIKKGYGKPPVDFVPDVQFNMGKAKLILDFGDSFFIDELLNVLSHSI